MQTVLPSIGLLYVCITSLSGPKALVLLQLLIPLETWSVVNVTADINV